MLNDDLDDEMTFDDLPLIVFSPSYQSPFRAGFLCGSLSWILPVLLFSWTVDLPLHPLYDSCIRAEFVVLFVMSIYDIYQFTSFDQIQRCVVSISPGTIDNSRKRIYAQSISYSTAHITYLCFEISWNDSNTWVQT